MVETFWRGTPDHPVFVVSDLGPILVAIPEDQRIDALDRAMSWIMAYQASGLTPDAATEGARAWACLFGAWVALRRVGF